MRIAYIVPGFGGTFYCQNCLRDQMLGQHLRAAGHEVLMLPMYLPISTDTMGGDIPVFYGAVNVYLKERVPLYRKAPAWLQQIMNAQPLLRLASGMSGSTDASGLEEMTLSVLQGKHGHQADELQRLVHWLQEQGRPDVVHLSNALLLGLAREIKRTLQVPVFCTLQDEDSWIESMDETYRTQAWQEIHERARDVAGFIAVSEYYAQKFAQSARLPAERIHTIPLAVDVTRYTSSRLPMDPPCVGYLSRFSEKLGLGILVDAFLILKRENRPDLQLRLTGGMTGEDKQFVRSMEERLRTAGVRDDVYWEPWRFQDDLPDFLASLTLLSVPVPAGEAFGSYQLEALASGVPTVLPAVGGFPEITHKTGGGVVYSPNTPRELARTIDTMLSDPGRLARMAARGQQRVRSQFSIEKLVKKLLLLYSRPTEKPGKRSE